MQDSIDNLPKLAKDKHNENKKFFERLKKKPPKDLDYVMQDLHDQEFKRYRLFSNVQIVAKLQVLCLPIRILSELPNISN